MFQNMFTFFNAFLGDSYRDILFRHKNTWAPKCKYVGFYDVFCSTFEFLSPACSIYPNWHELLKQEKCSSLAPPRNIFYKTQWTAMCQINLIGVNFYIQKSLETLNKKTTEGKMPCLTPIRENCLEFPKTKQSSHSHVSLFYSPCI